MIDQNVQNLIDIDMHLTRADIPHFLIGGTLLGAVRDGKLIDNDKDLDLGIFHTSRHDLLSVYNFLKQLEILNFRISKFYDTVITIDRGYRADIFNIYKSPMNAYLRLGEYEMIFPKECFSSLDTLKMYNKTFYIPKNSEQLLAFQYGEDWKTPRADFKINDCKNIRKCM